MRVFNSVEEIRKVYGVDVNIPEPLHPECNVVGFIVEDLLNIRYFQAYKENEQGFFTLACGDNWKKSSNSLEDEIEFDKSLHNAYIYLRLNKEVFTPKRLLGVATDHGYIQDVGLLYVTTTGYHYCTLDTLKFYISDYSDETVSFEEYVKMFYNGEAYEG